MAAEHVEAGMSKLGGVMVVASPTISGNVMGRVLCMARIAEAVVERVLVVAPDDGPLWGAASRWSTPVHRVRGEDDLARLTADGVDWVWVSKPLFKGWRLGRQVQALHPSCALLLDVDDDDAGLSREFMADSLLNWLRIHPFRQLHPTRIDKVMREARTAADGYTTSSYTLAEAMGLDRERLAKVPHACPPGQPWQAQWKEGRPKRLGFFGTVRKHKGLESVARMMREDPAVVLHTFEGPNWRRIGIDPGRIVEFPVATPHKDLFESIDVVTLPQRRSPAAEVQLPMKLIDAMSHGVPVMATPTKTITEMAGDTLCYVQDWSDMGEVEAALSRCLHEGVELGAAARRRFLEQLSVEAVAPDLRDLLERTR